MRAVLWAVEVRDRKDQPWTAFFLEVFRVRAHARLFQDRARRCYAFTRIVRYVRDEA